MSKEGNDLGLDILNDATSGDDGINLFQEIESIEDISNTSSTSTNSKKNTVIDDTEFMTEIESVEDIEKINNPDKEEEEEKVETVVDKTKDKVETTTETKETETTTETTNTSTNKVDEILSTFGEQLGTLGIVDFNKDEFLKAEDKDEYLQTQVAAKIAEGAEALYQEKIGELPAEVEELVNLHKKGIPLHKILEADAVIADYKSITKESITEKPELQKGLVMDLLIAQGWSEEKAQAKVKRYEDTGVLADEANEAHDSLIELAEEEKATILANEQRRIEEENKRREKRIEDIASTINAKTEIIPGVTLTAADKKKLIDGITKPSGKDSNGRVINEIAKIKAKDPDFDLKVAAFALLYDADFNKLLKKSETKVAKKLKDLVDENKLASGLTTTETRTTTKPDINVMKNALAFLDKSKR